MLRFRPSNEPVVEHANGARFAKRQTSTDIARFYD